MDRQPINSRYEDTDGLEVGSFAVSVLGFQRWRRPGWFGGQGLEPGVAGAVFVLGRSTFGYSEGSKRLE